MATAEFEEREYEAAVTSELSREAGVEARLFAAGTVLEKILGYDAVADVAQDHEIWKILDVQRPAGVVLIPSHWDPGIRPDTGTLPTVPISVVFQYKRPEYMYGHSAKQWRMWHRPYFRFKRTRHPQSVLLRLEESLREDALIRYMSPAFWRRGELEAAYLAGQILRRSGFVRPTALRGHSCWTYIAPGLEGRPNPNGESRIFEDISQLFSEIELGETDASRALVAQDDAFRSHLRLVGEAARRREPSVRNPVDRWIARVRSEVRLDPEVLEDLRDLTSITSTVRAIGAGWWLASRDIGTHWQ